MAIGYIVQVKSRRILRKAHARGVPLTNANIDRVRRTVRMQAMDEAGHGAVPDMRAILAAYKAHKAKGGK